MRKGIGMHFETSIEMHLREYFIRTANYALESGLLVWDVIARQSFKTVSKSLRSLVPADAMR